MRHKLLNVYIYILKEVTFALVRCVFVTFMLVRCVFITFSLVRCVFITFQWSGSYLGDLMNEAQQIESSVTSITLPSFSKALCSNILKVHKTQSKKESI